MSIKIIEYILQLVKNIATLCNKVVDSSDPQKYSDGVKSLGQSVDDTYAKMRDLIALDDSLSISEKIEKLDQLAKSQQAARQSCEEAIKENRDHIAKIVAEVFVALATCGISFIPKVIKGYKNASVAIPEATMIEGEGPIDRIEETCNNIINTNCSDS